MIPEIGCDALDAYIDDELSASEIAAFDRHVGGCADCHLGVERHMRLRARLRAGLVLPVANAGLRRRIMAAIPGEAPPRYPLSTGRRRWMEMAMAASIAAILASGATTYLLRPAPNEDWQRAILSAHLRATLSGHVIDVASSDRHTVKPWFGGKTMIAPAVVDLAAEGYPLIGGRLDIPDKDAVPVLVYTVGPHVASVFVTAATTETLDAKAVKVDGFSLLTWSARGLAYSAVSDADGAELRAFQRAFVAAVQQLP